MQRYAIRLVLVLMSACLLTGMDALPSEDRGIAVPPVSEIDAAPTVVPKASIAPPATARPVVTTRPVVAAAVAVVAHPTPAPDVCPATWFCYPKLGIRGPVVPYSDCTATIDIGAAIRRYTCAPGIYLMGHAYTDFGFIRAYQIGDSIIYEGKTFLITSASDATACQPMAPEQSALTLQTSLTFERCGKVLVLHAIPILR